MSKATDLTALFDQIGLPLNDRSRLCLDPSDLNLQPISSTVHAMRRAWSRDTLSLSAIYLTDSAPSIYIKPTKGGPITPRTFRQFWSNGIAPLLMQVDDREVRIYSSLSPPASHSANMDDQGRLVDLFDRSADGLLQLRRFIQAVDTHHVYRQAKYRKSFTLNQAVDQLLKQNLMEARDRLANGSHSLAIHIIHRLLIRMIFMRYMEERGVLNGNFFTHLNAGSFATFKEVLEAKCTAAQLYKTFFRLRKVFKGSLFDEGDLKSELRCVCNSHVKILHSMFFGREDMASRQLMLFEPYDFSIIPIETISAIYEEFLHAEEENEEKGTGSYYTPPRLVDLTIDLATQPSAQSKSVFDWSDRTKRVLDPGCGSGAFLVAAFNRFAEAWYRENPRARNRTKLRELSRILTEQITGVDISDTACRITCFSLYLAMLDFLEPRDIKLLTSDDYDGLPELLRKQSDSRNNSRSTVVKHDFLSPERFIDWDSYDLVVGNPPWISRTGGGQQVLAEWKSRHRKLPVPANEIACAFLWHVDRFMNASGVATMLVPSGIFTGANTNRFQEAWHNQRTTETVVQLADLRFFLFPGADHSCSIMRFRKGRPPADAAIEYLAPKATPAELNGDRITLLPEDRKSVSLQDLRSSSRNKDAPLLWHRQWWASRRDTHFLDRLLSLPKLREHAGEPGSGKRWNKGQGMKPPGKGTPATKERMWPKNAKFLDAATHFAVLLTPGDCTDVDPKFRKLHRCPDESIFKAPLVVFNKGFSKFAYSKLNVLFRHTIHSISGLNKDADLLMLLAASLASPIGEYFAFHCTSRPMYRNNPLFDEILRFPFPLPEKAPGHDAQFHIDEIVSIMKALAGQIGTGKLRDDAAITAAKYEMDKHVYAYYDISPNERVLIDDTISVISKSTTPRPGSDIPTIKPPSTAHLRKYAKTILDTFDRWARHGDVRLCARCVPSTMAGLCVMTFTQDRRKSRTRYRVENSEAALDAVLARLSELLPESRGSLTALRFVKVFDGDQLHIVKPMLRRLWLPSAALNDADEIAEAILAPKGRVAG